MNSYLLIILADIFFAIDFALQKIYQKKTGTGVYVGFFFNAFQGLFMSIVFLVVNRFVISFSFYSLTMAFAAAALVSMELVIGFRILKEESMSFYTLFLMTGGMTVPYIWGVVFLNEQVNLMKIIGIILIILSIVISNFSKKRPDKSIIILCVAVFFLKGFNGVVAKMHQVNTTYETVETMDFIFWLGIACFVICGFPLLFLKRKKLNFKNIDLKAVLTIVLLSAIVNGTASMWQLIGAIKIPASILYPLVTGGVIIFSSITEYVVFREKLPVHRWVGVGICFIGTCFFI